MVRAIRTSVITTLVQSDVTMRSQIANLDKYAGPRASTTSGFVRRQPAIVVSAGPAFGAAPARAATGAQKFVIIAVQTVLKPMLAGHQAALRDRSGLPRDQQALLRGPDQRGRRGRHARGRGQGQPAILDAWPGVLRSPKDNCLSKLLEQSDADRCPIKPARRWHFGVLRRTSGATR